MTDREQTYRDWCRLLLNGLITAGQVSKSLKEVFDDFPQFSPSDLSFIDIEDPFSPVCRLVRRAVTLGLLPPDDELLSTKPNIPAVNWRVTEV